MSAGPWTGYFRQHQIQVNSGISQNDFLHLERWTPLSSGFPTSSSLGLEPHSPTTTRHVSISSHTLGTRDAVPKSRTQQMMLRRVRNGPRMAVPDTLVEATVGIAWHVSTPSSPEPLRQGRVSSSFSRWETRTQGPEVSPWGPHLGWTPCSSPLLNVTPRDPYLYVYVWVLYTHVCIWIYMNMHICFMHKCICLRASQVAQ